MPRAVGHHRHIGASRGQRRKQACLHLGNHRPHMAHRAIAKKRHRAVCDPPLGLDFGPPDTPVAKAYPILVQRFWDDHMLHTRRVEPSLFGKMGNAAKTTCLLIGGAGNLDRATIIGTAGDEGLGGDDGAGKPALHVAGTTAIDPVTLDGGGERVSGPPLADRDNIGMGVEMHAVTAAAATGTFMPADDIPARIPV